MAIGRTSQRAGLDSLPSLPPGTIPAPRADTDSPPSSGARPRWRTVLLVAVPAVAAVGIGVTIMGLTQHSTPTESVAPPAPRSAADVGFLKIVRQQAGFATVTDDSLVMIGHTLCAQLERGVSPDEIALGSSSNHYAVEDVSTAVGAAAGAYCPDQIARVGQVQ